MKWPLLALAAALALAIAGCDKPAEAPVPQPAGKAGKDRAAQAQPATTAAPATAEPRVSYSDQGRRDPFVSLTGKRVAAFLDNPLESFDLPQFQLKAVIIGMGEPKAMVIAPDGKGYIIRKGMKFGKNKGVVVEISRDKVRVEERYLDLSGVMRRVIQDLNVPKREGV